MEIREIFTAKLEECYEIIANGGDISVTGITKLFNSVSELEECLSVIKSEQVRNQIGIEECDSRIKTWQQSKKAWKSRQESLLSSLQETLTSLGVKSVTDGSVKVKLSTTKGLEVINADEILKPYEKAFETFKSSLPPFIKISMDIDKTLLSAYLKTDNSLLLTMPENVHYKESKSVRIN